MKQLNLISLGAGVQSSTMALMAAHGEIEPMPDGAIFADTHAEPASVYEWLEWLEKELPFPVYRVSRGSLTEATLAVKTNRKTGIKYYSNMVPAFVRNPDGTIGKVQRHCTFNYKIKPITKKQRELAGIKRWTKERAVGGPSVVSWIGISLDEQRRATSSRESWCASRWPLIELGMRRFDCGTWMHKHGYPQPPRSACIYCPFHSNAEWARLKTKEPEEFTKAVSFERDLQLLHIRADFKGRSEGIPFLHRSCVPLDQACFLQDPSQLCLWPEEACGVCGV